MIHAKVVRLHTMLCLIVACVGCGRGQLPTAVVEGRVLYEGKPLAFGSVMFQPVAGGPIARGIIQADGSFRLTTYKPNDGAILGEHLVRISCFENQRPAESTAPSADVDALSQSLIPLHYGNPQSSGLRATVTVTNAPLIFELVETSSLPLGARP